MAESQIATARHPELQVVMDNRSIPDRLSSYTFYRGRVGLYAILKAIGIGEGDSVALQAFGCLAVPEGIMATEAKPLFIDISRSGFNMCPDDLQNKINEKVKAIIVQHTYGIPAEMERLSAVAAEHNTPIIEDCCHSFTSSYDQRLIGSFGEAAFYSFEWGKPIVIGVGGSVSANSDRVRSWLKNNYDHFHQPPFSRTARIQIQYLAHSMLYSPKRYWWIKELFQKLSSTGALEGNYNPPGDKPSLDFTLSMAKSLRRRLRNRIKHIWAHHYHSNSVAKMYKQHLINPQIAHPSIPDNVQITFIRYPLRTTYKDELLSKAKHSNMELSNWYNSVVHPLSNSEAGKVGYRGDCKNAELAARETVTLPLSKRVSIKHIENTVNFLNCFRS